MHPQVASSSVTLAHVVPFYQPIFALNSQRVYRYECLARLLQADQQITMPTEFLYIIERNHETADMTSRILELSSAYCRPRQMSWSINLFASDLNDRYLLSSIKELCRFSPRGLCGVELNFNCIEDKLVALGNLIRSMPNLHVTIDEVDQCNDSLDAVIASGIHAVKIKADLIAAHCQTSQGRALIERLQGLCNQHDCKLIAEHIETNQSLTAVKNMRIQYGQGFYLSHPVPKVIAVHSA